VLVYLASYPRSGNTWVRHLIGHHFGYNSASLYAEPHGAPNLEWRADGTFELFSYFEVLRRPGVQQRMLMNACGPVLSPALREQLGQSEDCFFLKTHELPFGHYFPGEHVLYMTRTPGAVFWSYIRYLHKNEAAYAATTLDQVIAGEVPFGSWSGHVLAWLAAREVLGERLILCSYEELTRNESRIGELLGPVTGLPDVTPPHPLQRLDHWHQVAPTLYRKEAESVWRPRFTPDQLRRVRELHGEAMRRVGYDTPDYRVSLIDRLRQVVGAGRVALAGGKQ
jgi:hypothetical protein